MPVAAGKGIEDPLAAVSGVETGPHRLLPERAGAAQPGVVNRPPAVVGYRGQHPVAGHGVRSVQYRGFTGQEVVAVDGRPRCHAAYSDTVVPARDYAGNVRAVVLQRGVYAAAARVVVIAGCVYIVLEVLMGEVHTVVHDGDVDAISRDAFRPGGFCVDGPSDKTVQVPLACVQRVADLRVVQRPSPGSALVYEFRVLRVLVGVDRIGKGGRPDIRRSGDLEIVSARSEVVPNEETSRLTVPIDSGSYFVDIHRNLCAVGVEHLYSQRRNWQKAKPLDAGSVNDEQINCSDDQVRGLGEVHPEVVRVACRANIPRRQGIDTQVHGRADGAAGVRRGLGVQPVVPDCPLAGGAVALAAESDVVDPSW